MVYYQVCFASVFRSYVHKSRHGFIDLPLQAGIGTYTTPQVATPIMTKVSQILDEMFAWNLDAHVMGKWSIPHHQICSLPLHHSGGYEFLMQNCKLIVLLVLRRNSLLSDLPNLDEAGDKICIFGFSRGAYTARALAGMIHKVRTR